jgi:hypothetical protein
MTLWPTTLRIEQDIRLLVRSPDGDDLIKARLPLRPRHPRALLTMLEGVALFGASPLCVVISAGNGRASEIALEQWCDDLWPAESPLVQFEFATPPRRARDRFDDAGNVRAARRQLRLVWSR